MPPPPPLAQVKGGEKRPLVSVVMPTYRRASLIGQTVRSILEQTLFDFELLVRDDGPGDDGTEQAVAAAAAGDERVRYHKNPTNLRMPGNLNDGIRESRGQFVAVCHDHDLFAPQFLEVLVGLLQKHPTALYAHAGLEGVDYDGKPTGFVDVTPWGELTAGRNWLERMLSGFASPVCALTVVRRSAHEQHGLYDPAYGFIADVEMWMRLAELGDVAYSNQPLVRIRERETDHFANTDPFPIYALTFAIHRHYVAKAFGGLERARHTWRLDYRADMLFVRALLSTLRRGKIPRLGAAKQALRRAAGPLGRVLSRVVP